MELFLWLLMRLWRKTRRRYSWCLIVSFLRFFLSLWLWLFCLVKSLRRWWKRVWMSLIFMKLKDLIDWSFFLIFLSLRWARCCITLCWRIIRLSWVRVCNWWRIWVRMWVICFKSLFCFIIVCVKLWLWLSWLRLFRVRVFLNLRSKRFGKKIFDADARVLFCECWCGVDLVFENVNIIGVGVGVVVIFLCLLKIECIIKVRSVCLCSL